MVHPWHDVSYGKKAPDEVNVVIEVPKDSKLKYELDKETGILKLDRALYSSVHYPGDYGFIPRTFWEDKDPLDILVLSNFPVNPLTIVKARPIGIIEMDDGNERDDKIIAVHSTDPRFNRYKSIKDVSEHMLLEIKHFFEIYKELQNQKVKVLDIKGLSEAKNSIAKSIKLYEQHFLKKNK